MFINYINVHIYIYMNVFLLNIIFKEKNTINLWRLTSLIFICYHEVVLYMYKHALYSTLRSKLLPWLNLTLKAIKEYSITNPQRKLGLQDDRQQQHAWPDPPNCGRTIPGQRRIPATWGASSPGLLELRAEPPPGCSTSPRLESAGGFVQPEIIKNKILKD